MVHLYGFQLVSLCHILPECIITVSLLHHYCINMMHSGSSFIHMDCYTW